MTEETALQRLKGKVIRRLYSYVCNRCGEVSFSCTVHITGFCSHSCYAFGYWDSNTDRKAKQDKDGYLKVMAPVGHPIRKRVNTARIGEHVLVMEQHLGRYLVAGENVHHKNGLKSDNRIDNLELWATNQPRGQKVIDLVEFVAENYTAEVLAKIEVKRVVRELTDKLTPA